MDQVDEARVAVRSFPPSTEGAEREHFASERDLVSAIRKAFSTTSSARWTWLAELDSPNGVADLVAVKLADAWRASPSLRTVPPRWAYALKCLPYQRRFTLAWFAEAIGATPSYARRILRMYAATGFCIRGGDDKTWEKVTEPQPIADKIVAVEAKLRDWRKALYQAARYLDYAVQSWVVLDQRTLSSAVIHADDFFHRGIGLMGLGQQGQVEVVSPARNRTPRMIGRFWQVNAEIARRLDASFLEESPVEAV